MSALSNWSERKVLCKNRNPYIWGKSMSYLGIFGLQLLKTIVIFDMTTLQFIKNNF